MSTSAVLLFVGIFIYGSLGFSGTVPPSCNIDSGFGCSAWAIVDDVEDRFNCTENPGIMPWAGAPAHVASMYSLSVRGGLTQYTPGKRLFLELEVLEYGQNFRGFVIYAENSDGARVGRWDTLVDDSYYYTPDLPADDPSGCGGTVMHFSAVLKPILSIFRFTAPSAGTGPITFKALIKQGNANTGEFYYPNSQPLQVSEGAEDLFVYAWVQSQSGQSCSHACTNIGSECVPEATAVNSRDQFEQNVVPNTGCSSPGFAACQNTVPSIQEGTSTCYYADPSCPTVNENSCDATSTHSKYGQRLCACKGKDFDAVHGNGALALSPSCGFSPAIFSLSLALFGFRRTWVFVFLLLALLLSGAAPVSGHNWMRQYSRSSASASQVFPCPVPRSPKPQMQLANNGQEFQLEWASGHGRHVYFALVSQEEETSLREHSAELFEQYIEDASAAGSPDLMRTGGQPNGYQKFHRSFTTTRSVGAGTLYEREVTSEPYFNNYQRPAEFLKSDEFVAQYQYTADTVSSDAIYQYDHPEYTWLKGVWKFEIEAHQPKDADFALFKLPDGLDAGRYILHYVWGGYYDCIDVNLLDQASDVANIYGTPVDGQQDQMRVDHCFYKGPNAFFPPPMQVIGGDLSPCIDRCLRHTDRGCAGIQVFPMYYPDTVPERWRQSLTQSIFYQFINDSFFPFDWPLEPNPTQAERYFDNDAIWEEATAAAERARLFQEYEDAGPDAYYCMPVQPAPKTDTTDIFVTTDDPRDPVFYGTCFQVVPRINFIGYGNISAGGQTGPTKFLDRCIDCESYHTSIDAHAPVWNIKAETQVCYDCEDVEPQAETTPPRLMLIYPGSFCQVGDWDIADRRPRNATCPDLLETCVIRLGPDTAAGWDDTETRNFELCAKLAAEEPNCAPNTYWVNNRTNDAYREFYGCRCYKREPACCGTCHFVREPGNSLSFELIPAGEEPQPDPTCARGKLSDDETICCSPECERCASNVDDFDRNDATDDPVGVVGSCRFDRIRQIVDYTGENRTCAKFGPPCIMAAGL